LSYCITVGPYDRGFQYFFHGQIGRIPYILR
jgi:hypothetical protein